MVNRQQHDITFQKDQDTESVIEEDINIEKRVYT